MERSETYKWLAIMKENLVDFPEISAQKKIIALECAVMDMNKLEKIEKLFKRSFAKKVFECGMETDLERSIKEVLNDNN